MTLPQLYSRLATRMSGLLRTAFGAGICAVLAAVVTAVAPHNSDSAILPLLFLAVVITLSLRFGEGAGILGTVVAAAIFAYFLFAPLGSLKIGSEAARTNVGWMLLVGISASFLLAPPAGRKSDRFDKRHDA